MKLDRAAYARLYGPTTGDRLRLADTALLVEIERDLGTYGDEAVFGGGKVIRDGMGQHPTATRDGDAVLDTVITNVDRSSMQSAASTKPMLASVTGESPVSEKPEIRG